MASRTNNTTINLGPQHPSTHGVLRLEVNLTGEIINSVEPHIGYLHRCFEKHCESLNYQQIIPFVDRLDYLASMNNSHAFVMGVEKLLYIDEHIPKRVEYIRVLVCELNRIASHLIALGTFAMDLGSVTPFMWCFKYREFIIKLLEKASGARLLYNYIWVGGIFYDIPLNFELEALSLTEYLTKNLRDLEVLTADNKIFIERTVNIGVISLSDIIDYGITGPIARASGLKQDLRKIHGYSIYNELDFDIPIGNKQIGVIGDSWNRFNIRVNEIKESIKIIKQCCNILLDKHVREKNFNPRKLVPKKYRFDSMQDFYIRAENPKGELGFYFITKPGSDKPFRVKVRAPSFNNLAIISKIAKGHNLADLPVILGSLDIVLGEIDR